MNGKVNKPNQQIGILVSKTMPQYSKGLCYLWSFSIGSGAEEKDVCNSVPVVEWWRGNHVLLVKLINWL